MLFQIHFFLLYFSKEEEEVWEVLRQALFSAILPCPLFHNKLVHLTICTLGNISQKKNAVRYLDMWGYKFY